MDILLLVIAILVFTAMLALIRKNYSIADNAKHREIRSARKTGGARAGAVRKQGPKATNGIGRRLGVVVCAIGAVITIGSGNGLVLGGLFIAAALFLARGSTSSHEVAR